MTPDQATVLLHQIGNMNVLAISGGRARLVDGLVVLPVSNGYTVEIALTPADDYTVRRVFTRSDKRFVKGELTGVYADEIGERAYEASLFRSYEFPKGVTA